jgi:hypothetical protein
LEALPTVDELLAQAMVLSARFGGSSAYTQALRPKAFGTDDMSYLPKRTEDVFHGDWALANSILVMRDGVWFLEVCQTVAIGDVGRVWEIMKVSVHHIA